MVMESESERYTLDGTVDFRGRPVQNWEVEGLRFSHRIQSIQKDVVPMNILRLLPQYILLGIADVFNAIGVLEFFYDQSPDDLQSRGTTFTSGIAVGNFMNSILATIVDGVTAKIAGKSWIGNDLNDSCLDYYYAFLVLLSTLNLGAFVWSSTNYIYQREANAKAVDVCLEIATKADSDKSFTELQET